MKRSLLSAHDGDKFALYRNSSLLSIASSLIFSRPCLSCHTADRKPPSARLVHMQCILLLLKLTLSQRKFAEMELMENPITFSLLALPFASCNPPHRVPTEGLISHQEGKSPSQRREQREDEPVRVPPLTGDRPYRNCTPAQREALSLRRPASHEIGVRVSVGN